jgi:hypothetical protein
VAAPMVIGRAALRLNGFLRRKCEHRRQMPYQAAPSENCHNVGANAAERCQMLPPQALVKYQHSEERRDDWVDVVDDRSTSPVGALRTPFLEKRRITYALLASCAGETGLAIKEAQMGSRTIRGASQLAARYTSEYKKV